MAAANPTKTSQKTALLMYLQQHQSIEPLTALRQLGVYRLGARIFDLRREGYDISTRLTCGQGSHYATYTLHQSPDYGLFAKRVETDCGIRSHAKTTTGINE